ncbi:actin-like ATPase domain-containing protein [Rostrohypoxylon terebratum]|nr:actin-like ATPase domain-containing protein [Rostrohypoxylon terebratum]
MSMNFNLPIRSSTSLRNQASRNYFTNYTPPSSTEAVNGPIREPARGLTTINDRLIVGVDFGTTFSGVAAVYTSTPDDVEIIKTWPGGNGITSDKVPTEISYDFPPNHTPETKPNAKWGFQFKPEESRLRCIKLFLDRSQKLPFYVSPQETATQLKKYNKTVIDAVSDYLTEIYKHTMDTLTRRYGESFMASTNVDFVLTCPAVWSDAAKNATLQAAERAGMGLKADIQIISEPEAAAVYTLKAIQPNHLSVGDNFIVCDAGGGTVDLIAYKIMSLKPLRVEESAVGTGGLCGSAFLNYRFEEHVRGRLGHSKFEEMKTKKAKTWQMGLRYFEEFVKRNFNEDEYQEVNVPFPGLPDDDEARIDSGFLVMTADEIKGIFEPVVKEVCDLVQGQVDGLRGKGGIVSGIILVGGFGQSDYLYRRLKAHFTSAAPPPYTERPTHAVSAAAALDGNGNIEVMQPVYAWTAVVRGAVLRGLEGNMVISRKARMHYGTSYATVYDEEKHTVSERYWSPLWERWMVSDRMQWHIAKVSYPIDFVSSYIFMMLTPNQGEAISPLSPISFHYTRNFRPGQSLVVTDDLIACEADEPPAAYSRELKHVCTLTTDLSAVPRSLFTRLTTTRGVEFDNLDFTLEMIVDSAGLSFELKVDGVRYGRVEAEFH